MDNSGICDLLDSWPLHLAAERKSPQTLKTYGNGVRRFIVWCAENNRPPDLDRATVNAFISGLLEAGAEPATVRSRQLAVRRFSAWCAEEGEIPADQLINLKPPQLDHKVVQELDDDQLRALIKACAGRQLRDGRDEAIVRLMAETATRAGEVITRMSSATPLPGGGWMPEAPRGGLMAVAGWSRRDMIDRYTRATSERRAADEARRLNLGDL